MPRVRERRFARLAAVLTAADDAAAWRGAALRARLKLGALLQQALARSGIDPATMVMPHLGDEAEPEAVTTVDGGQDAGRKRTKA
jgi:hypothetical protein